MVTPKVDAPQRVVNNRLSPIQTLFEDAPAAEPPAPDKSHREPLPPPERQRRRKTTLAQTIQDAALHQDVDPVKFDRLLIAQEKFAAKEGRIAFDTAFSQMQAELPVIGERGTITDWNGAPASTYALWEDINEAIKPIISKFGFALRFKTGQDHNTIIVTAILSHSGGHSEETTMRLPVDLSGGKNPVQAIGSSTSYGKRYTASALLNLTSRGEDDDGKAAVQSARITAEEIADLRHRISVVKCDERRLKAYLGVASLEELPPSKLDRAKQIIEARGTFP